MPFLFICGYCCILTTLLLNAMSNPNPNPNPNSTRAGYIIASIEATLSYMLSERTDEYDNQLFEVPYCSQSYHIEFNEGMDLVLDNLDVSLGSLTLEDELELDRACRYAGYK